MAGELKFLEMIRIKLIEVNSIQMIMEIIILVIEILIEIDYMN